MQSIYIINLQYGKILKRAKQPSPTRSARKTYPLIVFLDYFFNKHQRTLNGIAPPCHTVSSDNLVPCAMANISPPFWEVVILMLFILCSSFVIV